MAASPSSRSGDERRCCEALAVTARDRGGHRGRPFLLFCCARSTGSAVRTWLARLRGLAGRA
eukprot:2096068-Alexandrium_andersonii.AAC.1